MARSASLSRTGLDRVHDSMATHVAAGHVAGIVTLVACGGDVHTDAIGTPSFVDDTPLARDAIFRIASLRKPITAVATMSLVQEGLLGLEDPIDDLRPELATRRVLRALDADLANTVPAATAIVLRSRTRMGPRPGGAAAGTSNQPLPCGIGWDGGSGTTWRSHPRVGVTGILFTQRQAVSPASPPVIEDFWRGVNALTTS